MLADIPRLMLAGTRSGSGKTSVVCAVLQAFVNRTLRPAAFKCGPDYIDPMFHREALGVPSANLDPFFFSADTMRYLLWKHGAGQDISVMEGVMGYYDGLGLSDACSSYTVAARTETPVVLVVEAKGVACSLLAEIEGFVRFRPDSRIRGVLFNRCAAHLYPLLADAVREHFGGMVQPLGFLPPLPDASLESRHLGLVTPAELRNLREKLRLLADAAEQYIDLIGLRNLARTAPPVVCEPPRLPPRGERVRIALARDSAFCFYYEDSLALLRELGAEWVPFSPLTDTALPENIHGLYLGGGYPEVCAEQLSGNVSMRRAVRDAVAGGLPCIAECGGFLYLLQSLDGFPMAGVLPGDGFAAGKLTRFGYVTLRAKADNLLCAAGEEIPAHEFHYWDATEPGGAFTAVKPTGRRWPCAVATKSLYAGFPHFHFYANPAFAVHFYQHCLEVKHAHEAGGD